MNGKNLKYPTDEELNRFIEEMESQELYAPAHLKEEILRKVQAPLTTQDRGKKTSKGQPVSFFIYTLKMAAGMAAAVAMVFLIPINDGSSVSRAEEIRQELDNREAELQKEQEKSREASLDVVITRYLEQIRNVSDHEKEDLADKLNSIWRNER